jgi:hypothetical protein
MRHEISIIHVSYQVPSIMPLHANSMRLLSLLILWIPSSTAFLSLYIPILHPSSRTNTALSSIQKRNQNNNNNNINNNVLLTQVLSDVDDTLKSSGGVNVAGVALGGIDVQYERGDFYPGVAQFMLELSLRKSDRTTTDTPPKVAILTARAEEFKVALELKETSKLAIAFREAGEEMNIANWGLGPVLYGSVAEWIVQNRKGLRKFSNFERLLQQDPTGTILQYIYVGDTGELDQEAAETMLREYPQVVKAVFLHVVSDLPNPEVPTPKLINGRPILFFRTYVGAATMATQLQFIDEEGLQRVIAAAVAKLTAVAKTSDKWIDLNRDFDEAYQTLQMDPAER